MVRYNNTRFIVRVFYLFLRHAPMVSWHGIVTPAGLNPTESHYVQEEFDLRSPQLIPDELNSDGLSVGGHEIEIYGSTLYNDQLFVLLLAIKQKFMVDVFNMEFLGLVNAMEHALGGAEILIINCSVVTCSV